MPRKKQRPRRGWCVTAVPGGQPLQHGCPLCPACRYFIKAAPTFTHTHTPSAMPPAQLLWQGMVLVKPQPCPHARSLQCHFHVFQLFALFGQLSHTLITSWLKDRASRENQAGRRQWHKNTSALCPVSQTALCGTYCSGSRRREAGCWGTKGESTARGFSPALGRSCCAQHGSGRRGRTADSETELGPMQLLLRALAARVP